MFERIKARLRSRRKLVETIAEQNKVNDDLRAKIAALQEREKQARAAINEQVDRAFAAENRLRLAESAVDEQARLAEEREHKIAEVQSECHDLRLQLEDAARLCERYKHTPDEADRLALKLEIAVRERDGWKEDFFAMATANRIMKDAHDQLKGDILVAIEKSLDGGELLASAIAPDSRLADAIQAISDNVPHLLRSLGDRDKA